MDNNRKTGGHERKRKLFSLLTYFVLTVCISAVMITAVLLFMSKYNIGKTGEAEDVIVQNGTVAESDIEPEESTEEETEEETTAQEGEPTLETEEETEAESEEETEEETTESQSEDEIIAFYRAEAGEERHSSVGHNAPYTIIIDPGHGFSDPGCIGYLDEIYEEGVTFAAAEQLKTYLENYGFTVYLTHDSESFLKMEELFDLADSYGIVYDKSRCDANDIYSAYERTVYANALKAQYGADLMISLHVNAVENGEHVTGMEFDYSIDTYWSDISKGIFDNITEYLQAEFPDTKLKLFEDSWDMSYIVTKYVDMPSILLEMGYATSKSDSANLMDDAYRDRLVKAIANGIYQYFCGI